MPLRCRGRLSQLLQIIDLRQSREISTLWTDLQNRADIGSAKNLARILTIKG